MASKCFHGIIEREALENRQKILLSRPEVVSLKQIVFKIFKIKLRLSAQNFEVRLKSERVHLNSADVIIVTVKGKDKTLFNVKNKVQCNSMLRNHYHNK